MTNLLHKAYENAHAGNVQSAIDALETLVCMEPMNVEAWEAYMQICGTCEDLDILCERVLQISGLTETDRESIVEYYYFLRQRFKSCNLNFERQTAITLELVDQFDFTITSQPQFPGKSDVFVRFKRFFVRLLGKIIYIPYLVLLFAGLNLLSAGNNFGYWVLVVLLLGICSSLWRVNLKMVDAHQKLFARQVIFSHKRNDEIGCSPEFIR